MIIKNIINGWGNYISNNEQANNSAKIKAEICSKCPHIKADKLLIKLPDTITIIQGKKCDKCGCPLSSKLRSISKCPLDKF